jgi:hypothetical protein
VSLIQCVDCGVEVSDSADACLQCGRRMAPPGKYQPWRDRGIGTVIASLIGLLALLMSGYTAWIQREQIRAQVWPNIVVGYNDEDRLLAVMNKGVGPAQVRSVQVFVDGKLQPDWRHVFDALGLPTAVWQQSALNANVLSSNERLNFMSLESKADYDQFRQAAATRLDLQICFCSTLNECWLHSGQNVTTASVQEQAACPAPATAAQFRN